MLKVQQEVGDVGFSLMDLLFLHIVSSRTVEDAGPYNMFEYHFTDVSFLQGIRFSGGASTSPTRKFTVDFLAFKYFLNF